MEQTDERIESRNAEGIEGTWDAKHFRRVYIGDDRVSSGAYGVFSISTSSEARIPIDYRENYQKSSIYAS